MRGACLVTCPVISQNGKRMKEPETNDSSAIRLPRHLYFHWLISRTSELRSPTRLGEEFEVHDSRVGLAWDKDVGYLIHHHYIIQGLDPHLRYFGIFLFLALALALALVLALASASALDLDCVLDTRQCRFSAAGQRSPGGEA